MNVPSLPSPSPSLWTRLLVIGVLLVAGALWVRQGDQFLWSLASPNTGQGTRGPGDRPPPGGPSTPNQPAEPLYYGSDAGQTAHADGIIAVTGSYGVGTSVLYVIDTRTRQLAVYEARGGSANSRKVFLVGARRIDLDLQLEGYNDDSEHPYGRLRDEFRKVGHALPLTPGLAPGLAPGLGSGSGAAGAAVPGSSDASTGRKEYTPGTPPKTEVNK